MRALFARWVGTICTCVPRRPRRLKMTIYYMRTVRASAIYRPILYYNMGVITTTIIILYADGDDKNIGEGRSKKHIRFSDFLIDAPVIYVYIRIIPRTAANGNIETLNERLASRVTGFTIVWLVYIHPDFFFFKIFYPYTFFCRGFRKSYALDTPPPRCFENRFRPVSPSWCETSFWFLTLLLLLLLLWLLHIMLYLLWCV